MELSAFYDVLLPESGPYCIFNKITKKHVWVETRDELLEASEVVSQQADWYFATASYAEVGTQFWGREASRVTAKRCFYLDIDAGEEKFNKQGGDKKAYETQALAIKALSGFIKESGVRPTMVMSSGAGLHVYYALDEDLDDKRLWSITAVALGAMAKKYGLLVDGSCTTDLARVLRPVGALHANGNTVKVLSASGPVYSLEAITDAVRQYLPKPKPTVNADIREDKNAVYSPKSAAKIADHCGIMAEMRETKGNIPEPEWRAMLGIIKHCVEGEELAHEWSSGYEGYSFDETQDRLDRWEAGPTTCDFVDSLGCHHCATCSYRGKINSPIALGRMSQEQQVEAGVEEPPAVVEAVEPATGERLPPNFNILEGSGFGVEWKDGVPTLYGHKRVMKEDEATGAMVPVMVKVPFIRHNLFYFTCWSAANASVGEMVEYTIIYRNKARDWREAPFSGVLTGSDKQAIVKYLAGFGVNLIDHDADSLKMLVKYILMSIGETKLMRSRPVASKSFGFQFHDDSTPMYVHGGVTVHEDLKVVSTLLRNDLGQYRPNFALSYTNHKPDGDTYPDEVWDDIGAAANRFADAFRRAYPSDKMGVYQLATLAGISSSYLMFVSGRAPDRREGTIPAIGFVVSLFSPKSGTGKTGVQKIAALAMADYEKFMPNGNNGISIAGISILARTLGTLPLNIDEASNFQGDDASTLVHMLSYGRDKARGQSDGSMVSSATWALVSLWSTNTSLRDLLADHRASTPAEQLRLLELNFNNDEVADSRIDRLSYEAIVDTEMVPNKGAIGLMLARYALQNFDNMRSFAKKYEERLVELFGLSTQERYYAQLGAALMLTLQALNRMGIDMFDRQLILHEFKRAIEHSRTYIAERHSNNGDHFREAMRAMAPHVAVTEGIADLRLAGASPDMMQNEHGLRLPLKGRLVKGSGICYISMRDLRSWCAQEKVNYKTMLDEAMSNGWINRADKEPERFNLAKGIPKLPPMQSVCIKVNARVFDEEVASPAPSNVVQMSAKAKHEEKPQPVEEKKDGTSV